MNREWEDRARQSHFDEIDFLRQQQSLLYPESASIDDVGTKIDDQILALGGRTATLYKFMGFPPQLPIGGAFIYLRKTADWVSPTADAFGVPSSITVSLIQDDKRLVEDFIINEFTSQRIVETLELRGLRIAPTYGEPIEMEIHARQGTDASGAVSAIPPIWDSIEAIGASAFFMRII